jgi:hypothetical protein
MCVQTNFIFLFRVNDIGVSLAQRPTADRTCRPPYVEFRPNLRTSCGRSAEADLVRTVVENKLSIDEVAKQTGATAAKLWLCQKTFFRKGRELLHFD